ncbi:acyltransferase [Methylosinus sp. H3A]|uniref:acyltransferase family protein n=1 Tax=Methylosinus sp. H3A TaxID=2785786 RepID=UPI0018C31E63|nr:acyltransferase [Methylosinus sp. H3A]MBG0812329.1 acyltransferase [Methylosinus sp. H3A]
MDELRGLAITSVLLSHLGLVFGRDAATASAFNLPVFGVGVDLFFVISGFVIVQNVHALREAAGTEFWRGAMAFWARRALRIALPAWATIAAIALWASGASIADLEAAAGFYGNFHWAPCFEGAGDCGDALATSHFWSLAIEMQFYAVAPLVGALSLNQTRAVAAAILLAGALTPRPWGGFLWAFRADGLMIGALLAQEQRSAGSWCERAPPIGVGLATFWLMIAATLARVFGGGASGAGLVLVAAIFGFVVAGSVREERRGWAALASIGRLSFSIYLVHLPIFAMTRAALERSASGEVMMLAAIGATTAAAIALDRLAARPAQAAARILSERICRRLAGRRTATGSVTR